MTPWNSAKKCGSGYESEGEERGSVHDGRASCPSGVEERNFGYDVRASC